MKYLIIHIDKATNKQEAFYTDWYQYDICYPQKSDCTAIVINLAQSTITFDGKQWDEIEDDKL